MPDDGIQWRNLAQAGYEAYAASTDNKNFRGAEMPKFDDLPEAIINAWIQATLRVCELYAVAVMN